MLVEIRKLTAHTRLGIWRMDEAFEGTPRQRERQTAAMLLAAMTGDSSLQIAHEPSGKPFITPLPSSGIHHPCLLSISHTKGFLVILLSDGMEHVGVDVEYRSDRVERIASRYIRPDENASSTDEKLLIWSAKEAVYKLFSEENLQFFDMRTCRVDGTRLQVENMKRHLVVDVCYEFTEDYVLTYVLTPTVLPA